MDNDPGMDQLTEDDLLDDSEVDTMVRDAVTAAVGDAPFAHAKIDVWAGNIVEGCLKRLAALNKPFKYVITCNLSQKAGAGLHAASCTRWSDKTDGKLVVQWCGGRAVAGGRAGARAGRVGLGGASRRRASREQGCMRTHASVPQRRGACMRRVRRCARSF